MPPTACCSRRTSTVCPASHCCCLPAALLRCSPLLRSALLNCCTACSPVANYDSLQPATPEQREQVKCLPNVALADEHTGVVDALCQTLLEDQGLQAPLQEILR